MRDDNSLAQRLEAMLTVALEPISAEEMADVAEVDVASVTTTLRELRAEYQSERRGFALVELASGWEMRSSPNAAEWVMRFANRDVSHRLSSAALETLAIVAYRQPISRAQISSLRGVNVDGVCRLLEQRGYIVECGRAPGPGLPILYATTDQFLDRLGLASLRDLPPVEEFMPALETARDLADELSLVDGDAFEGA
ncbi:MAG TPA: SMC-Scp complex subunit ScpB [Acidimicrobiales bacterium]|nr:SMC-Scp complex subunit ScpB [Acidimicrobiales bacterium]